MALALRLRQALAAASTSASLLRPGSSAASRSLPLGPLVPPLPRPHLPGAAAGFRSTAAAAARGGDYGGGVDNGKISPDEILFEGCDYNHWLITMEFPDPKPSREDMIETYLQTVAKVVGRSTRSQRGGVQGQVCQGGRHGAPYLRKVDLEAYAGYDQLLAALQDKFFAHFTIRRIRLFCPCVLFGQNVQALREDIPWTTPCTCHAVFVEVGIALAILTAIFHGVDPRTSFLIGEGLVFIVPDW